MACKQLLWLDPFSYRSPLELFQLVRNSSFNHLHFSSTFIYLPEDLAGFHSSECRDGYYGFNCGCAGEMVYLGPQDARNLSLG
jgi:hypothetical protein